MIETNTELVFEKISNGIIATHNDEKTFYDSLLSLLSSVTSDSIDKYKQLSHYQGRYEGYVWRLKFQIEEIHKPCNETSEQQ